jgi:hypothetical protein
MPRKMTPCAFFGEEGHRRAGLLEGDPKEDVEEGKNGDGGQCRAFPRVGQRRMALPSHAGAISIRLCRHVADRSKETPLERKIDYQAQHHAEPRGAEADVPVVAVGQLGTDDLADGRAQVDAHVENGEGSVAPAILLRIELTHHGRDVRLEKSGAENDEREPDEERWFGGHCEAEMARGDDDAADDDGAVGADQSVGQVAAQQRREINQALVPAVKVARLLLAPPETARAADEKQGQKRPHSVEREALPHLDAEEQK